MSERIPRLVAFLLSATLVFLTACASSPPTPTPTIASKPATKPTVAAPSAKPTAPSNTAAPPASSALEKLKIAKANVSGTFGALMTTKEAKLFEKYGLDADIAVVNGATAANASLLSGNAQIVAASGSSVINSILGGADAVIIASVVDWMPYQVVTVKDVNKAEDLKGKKIGINRFGGTADFAARYWLKGKGIDPEKDVSILQVGGQAERFAALKNGAVQAILVDPPYNVTAARQGFKVLVDLSELDIPYASTVFITTRSFLNSKTDTVRKFAKAYTEGIALYKSNPQLGIETLKKYLKLDDSEVLSETYKYWSGRMEKVPLVRTQGVRLILDQISANNPKAKETGPEKIMDMRVVKELETSGFVDSVQKH